MPVALTWHATQQVFNVQNYISANGISALFQIFGIFGNTVMQDFIFLNGTSYSKFTLKIVSYNKDIILM